MILMYQSIFVSMYYLNDKLLKSHNCCLPVQISRHTVTVMLMFQHAMIYNVIERCLF